MESPPINSNAVNALLETLANNKSSFWYEDGSLTAGLFGRHTLCFYIENTLMDV